jgi:hypothetical protein
MANCDSCSGGCEKCNTCGGCGGALELTEGEIRFLQTLAQIPFLPVARRADDAVPIYLEEQEFSREAYSLILQCLEKKGLISLDYDRPLGRFDDAAYAAYPVRGSMALTKRGQHVVQILEIQGILS